MSLVAPESAELPRAGLDDLLLEPPDLFLEGEDLVLDLDLLLAMLVVDVQYKIRQPWELDLVQLVLRDLVEELGLQVVVACCWSDGVVPGAMLATC